jgi:hypothetical protein
MRLQAHYFTPTRRSTSPLTQEVPIQHRRGATQHESFSARWLPLRSAAWPGPPCAGCPAHCRLSRSAARVPPGSPSPLCVLANRPPPEHGPHSRAACRARWSAGTWPTARAAPPKLQLGELIVCGMGWRARGRECGAQQREIGPNQRSCAGAKGLRREERHGRQGSASCRVRSSCRVGKLAAGQEEGGGGDPAIQVRSSCGWTWVGRRGTWPAACARSREADGEGARLEWRTGCMSGWEAGSEHGQPVRRAWSEGVVLLAGGWAVPSKLVCFPPLPTVCDGGRRLSHARCLDLSILN